MNHDTLIRQMKSAKEFFDRSTRCLKEEHSSFKPTDGSMTVAQQVAHVGQTVEWFLDGAFDPKGLDEGFEEHMKPVMATTSLKDARAWVDRAFARLEKETRDHTIEEWFVPFPEKTIMGGAPRMAIFGGIDDHTAHHRGALTVYSRLLGLVPAMPYMDMETPV